MREAFYSILDARRAVHYREVVIAEADFYRDILWTSFDSDPKLVALSQLQSLELRAAKTIVRRAKKVNADAEPPIDWLSTLKVEFKEPKSRRAKKRHKAALVEKETALRSLFKQRLSILTGGAGTGKTSVLKVFLQELVRAEGRNPMLLLAPTDKARVRLSTKTKRNAMTIHKVRQRCRAN